MSQREAPIISVFTVQYQAHFYCPLPSQLFSLLFLSYVSYFSFARFYTLNFSLSSAVFLSFSLLCKSLLYLVYLIKIAIRPSGTLPGIKGKSVEVSLIGPRPSQLLRDEQTFRIPCTWRSTLPDTRDRHKKVVRCRGGRVGFGQNSGTLQPNHTQTDNMLRW